LTHHQNVQLSGCCKLSLHKKLHRIKSLFVFKRRRNNDNESEVESRRED